MSVAVTVMVCGVPCFGLNPVFAIVMSRFAPFSAIVGDYSKVAVACMTL